MVNYAWITFLAKGGGPNKRFQKCLNPDSSRHFLYFRAIQFKDIQEVISFYLELQDTVLLSEDFTEYIYHIGNISEMHSIIRGGLIPGGRSLKRDRQSVFFTTVSPMDDDQSMEDILGDLDKATWTSQGSFHTKTLGYLTKTQCMVQLKNSLRREDCNFTKHDHTQSFSTTHCLRFILRKEYA